MSWKDIRGWTDGHLEAIYAQAVADAEQGDILVEIGVAYGRSLALLARLALDARKRVRIIGVDPWADCDVPYGGEEHRELHTKAGSYYEACVLEMMTHAPEEYANVTLLRMGSVTAAQKFERSPGMRPAFVFIDGDHSYESVLSDVVAWAPLTKTGGVIAGHDCTPSYPGVERAVREYFNGDFEHLGSCWKRRMRP
jgi:cephalosporin hydroxylase